MILSYIPSEIDLNSLKILGYNCELWDTGINTYRYFEGYMIPMYIRYIDIISYDWLVMKLNKNYSYHTEYQYPSKGKFTMYRI